MNKWVEVRNPYANRPAPGMAGAAGPVAAGGEYRMAAGPRFGPPNAARPQPFNSLPPQFAHGEYVERDRLIHTPSYRLRVDDQLELVYRLTRNEISRPYEFQVGDRLRIESMTDPTLNRDTLQVQPDGTITVRLLGQIRAAGRTVDQLRNELEEQYKKFYRVPAVTVTPLEVNTRLYDLRDTVIARFGNGGQSRFAKVTPEGTIQLPVIGSIPAQGLTIDELAREISERYAREIDGIEVMPVLVQRAPRFVYVLGEVRQPGRYTMEGPTSVMQAISLAGGWNVGANLTQVVVFRRDDEWRLMACMVGVWNPVYGNTTQAPGDIWLGDSDVVIVPKMKILVIDEFIELIFTRGIYGVLPMQGITINMAKLSTL
jgi:polysaccharide export outer membrane protein